MTRPAEGGWHAFFPGRNPFVDCRFVCTLGLGKLHPDRVDMAGMRGECERRQVWGWNDNQDQFNVTVEFESLLGAGKTAVSSFDASHWSYKQQGYVRTATSSRCKRAVPCHALHETSCGACSPSSALTGGFLLLPQSFRLSCILLPT